MYQDIRSFAYGFVKIIIINSLNNSKFEMNYNLLLFNRNKIFS